MTAFATPAQRWAGIGPYYAMFPIPFADAVVEAFTDPGDLVLDPFAGRASSIFSAATRDRPAIGVEINPVGWVYGNAKLFPALHRNVDTRLTQISDLARAVSSRDIRRLPAFFRYCFHSDVLKFLLAARSGLRWRSSRVDRTLMAFILVYLHGKQGQALSNQMRQSKAMSPQYSINWWRCRGSTPPEVNPVDFLRPRIAWRYAKGLPVVGPATLALGDSSRLLPLLAKPHRPAKLLFTSPPYLGITNYYYDQWLRLWMLGGPDLPRGTGETHKGKFESHSNYRALLSTVFATCSDVMDDAGYVYVRTDARPGTLAITREVLETAFRNWAITATERPFARPTQTALFGDKSNKPGEIDLVLRGPKASKRSLSV